MKKVKILEPVHRKPAKRSPATNQQAWLGKNKDGCLRLVLQTGLGPIDFAVAQLENGDFHAIGEPFGDILANPDILEKAFAAASKVIEEHGSNEFVFKKIEPKGSSDGFGSYKNPSKAIFASWLRGHLKFLNWSLGPNASEHDTPARIAHQAFRAGFLYAHMLIHDYEQFAASGLRNWSSSKSRRDKRNPVWAWLEAAHPDWRKRGWQTCHVWAEEAGKLSGMHAESFRRKFYEERKKARR